MLKTLWALRNRQAKHGFTLIELLVVVAIIGILATFAFPRVYEAIQQVNDGKGRTAIKSLSTALEQEFFKSGAVPGGTSQYPTDDEATLKTKLLPYMKSGFTFKNAHGAGYLYLTTDSAASKTGKGYILVDFKRAKVSDTLSICGASITVTADLQIQYVTASTLASCNPATGSGSTTNDIYWERN